MQSNRTKYERLERSNLEYLFGPTVHSLSLGAEVEVRLLLEMIGTNFNRLANPLFSN